MAQTAVTPAPEIYDRIAQPPPYPVGTRLRYVGENGWARGDGADCRPEDMRWCHPGDVGEVIEVREGFDALPHEDYALHGWSVVRFPSGVTAAVLFDSDRNYQPVGS